MQTIDLDICRYAATQSICVKQGDVGRKFKVRVMDCGVEFPIPAGAKLSVWYSGTSGEGNYSEINGRSAFATTGNTVTVEIIAQMVMNKGGGTLCLIIHNADGTQLGMWSIPYLVEAVPGMDSAPAQHYYTALSETATKALEGAERAEKAASLLNATQYVNEGDATLETQLRAAYAGMENGTNRIIHFIRNGNPSDFSLGGGSGWMVLISRTTDKYGSMIAWQYGEEFTIIKTRSFYNGVWGDWKKHSPNLTEESWVELWKNADPVYSKFPKQVMQNANFSKYKSLYVLFRHSNTYGLGGYEPVVSGMAVRIYPAATIDTNNIAETFRYFNRTDADKISFQSGYQNGALDESACVPVAIYGVRY